MVFLAKSAPFSFRGCDKLNNDINMLEGGHGKMGQF
jgi:hypothetical protein